MICFNCGATDDVRHYSFDLDLPLVVACGCCVVALARGDDDMLAELRGGPEAT